jgi:DNA repair exonuclease SbcCD ATPase subunit
MNNNQSPQPPSEAHGNMEQLLSEFNLLKEEFAKLRGGLLSKEDVELIAQSLIGDRPTVAQVQEIVSAAQDAASKTLKRQMDDFAKRMEALSASMQQQFTASINDINAKSSNLDTGIKTVEKLSGQMELLLTLIQRADKDVQRLNDRMEKQDESYERRLEKIETAQTTFVEEKTELRAGVQRISEQVVSQKTDTAAQLTRIENILTAQDTAIKLIQTEWLGVISMVKKGLQLAAKKPVATAVFTFLTPLGLTKFAELFQQFVNLLGH